MRRPAAVGAAALAALAALPALAPPARPQSSAAFAGNYRLTLGFGPSCAATVRSVSVFLVLSEKALTAGSEVDGRPAIAAETAVADLAVHRVGSTVHGPFATLGSRTDREVITTVEGYSLAPWLVLDGTVAAGSGRPSARGTAMGLLQAGRPEDESPDTLGACTAADHAWALDPV